MKSFIDKIRRYKKGEIRDNCLRCHKKTWHIFANRKTRLDVRKAGSPIRLKRGKMLFVEPKPMYFLVYEDSYACENCGRIVRRYPTKKISKEEAEEIRNRNKK
ncbi:MAG: hypothetical protein IIU65_05865 [Clostridia bacterium]|nr:hypothetical protein [Clostridia bacterium]